MAVCVSFEAEEGSALVIPSASPCMQGLADGITNAEPSSASKDTHTAIRSTLPFEISDEAIDRGLGKIEGAIDGAIKDLGAALSPADRDAVLHTTLSMYKLTEGLATAMGLAARDPYSPFASVRTFDDVFKLTPEALVELGKAVERRTTLERAEFGIAFNLQFAAQIAFFIRNPRSTSNILPLLRNW